MTITNLTDKELLQAQRIAELEAEVERLKVAAKYAEHIDATPENQRETMLHDALTERNALRAQIETVPTEVTEVAQVAIESVLREYNYPANPKNAARAGWRACRLHIAAMKGAAA